MAHARLIVAIVITFCCVSQIDPAAIQLENILDALKRLNSSRTIGGPRLQRAIDSESESKQICYNTPCGWEVYKPFTRQYEYFMKNTCECPDSSFKCVRVDDDLSVSAYVYHCLQNTTAKDIEEPPENAD